mgnify:CR=1 FL=1
MKCLFLNKAYEVGASRIHKPDKMLSVFYDAGIKGIFKFCVNTKNRYKICKKYREPSRCGVRLLLICII